MTEPRRRARNWKRIAGITAVSFAAVMLSAFVAAALLAGGLANRQKDAWARELSRRLEREVAIERVEVSLLRGSAELRGVRIGRARHEPQGTPGALELERASIDVGVIDTLMSFGRRPHVQSLALRGLRVHVVRLPDGTLNWQDIARRLRGPERPEPRADERVRNTVVDDARIEDAEVAFVELAGGSRGTRVARKARIADIALLLQDAGYERGGRVALRASVLSPQPNLELHARSSGVKQRRGGTPLPRVDELRLELEPTQLEPLAPFLAALRGNVGGTLERGVLSANVTGAGDAQAGAARGVVTLAGARFGGGQPFDAKLDFDLAARPKAGRLDVRQALLQVGEMRVTFGAALADINDKPRVEQLTLRSQNLSFDRLHALYPALDRRTAPLALRGPFALEASGSGTKDAQRAELELTLTQASVRAQDRFEKPAGTPLVLRAALRAGRDTLDISHLTLQLAEFRLAARGRVRDLRSDTPHFDVTLDTPEPAAASLLRLLPPVARALPSARGVPGTLAIHGKFEGTSEKYDGSAELALAGLDLHAEGATFAGGGQAKLELRKRRSHFEADVRADFTQLRAAYLDVIRKPEPTPLTFEAHVRGEPGRPASLQVEVPEFAVVLGSSDLRGSLRLRNLDQPHIALNARSRYLDDEDFLPGGVQAHESGATGATPRKPQPMLAKTDGTIALRVNAGRVSGIEYEDLDAKLTLHDGRARADKLEVAVFGGKLSGQGSELPLPGARGPYRVRGRLSGLQMQDVLTRFTGAPELLRGALTGSLDVTSEGSTLDALRNTLTGQLSGRVDDAELTSGNPYVALSDQLKALASVPQLKQTLSHASQRLPDARSFKLDDLTGKLRFERGAVLIDEPLVTSTPQGKLSLGGRLSLSDSGALSGTWALEPKAIEALVGQKLDLEKPVPVELRVSGPLTRPRFGFGDLSAVVEPLVAGYAKTHVEGEALKQLERALEKGGFGTAPEPKPGEERGAKRGEDKDKDRKKSKKKKRDSGSVEDKAKREIERQLPKLF